MSSHELWFAQPATVWTEALPLGNGRLGVMAHGGVEVDHLQINDGTAWSGSPLSERAAPRVPAAVAQAAVAEARRVIDLGRFDEAARELQKLQHRHSQSYMPFGDLRLTTASSGTVTDYRRTLDLRGAVHTVAYRVDGHEVRRELIVSRPHGVAAVRVTTTHPDGLDLRLELSSVVRTVARHRDSGTANLELVFPAAVSPPVDGFLEPVVYSDDPAASMQGALALGWTHDGRPAGRGTAATGVRSALIAFATETTFTAIGRAPIGTSADAREQASERVRSALALGFDELRSAQAEDHAALYDRVDITLGAGPGAEAPHTGGATDSVPDAATIPLDERLLRGNDDPDGVLAHDPALAALLYNYGRYLLICSSRPGGLPANLQGIWNDLIQPPWSGNYTTNINVEMNYWPAEVANLSECTEPLFDLIDALTEHGRETAARLYGGRGWVAHHNTDPWAYTQPVGWGRHDPRWAFWPLAGAWLCRHLWEHVLFGAGADFARDRAWVPIRSAAEFYLDWLVEMPDGSLGTSPSSSPENVFLQADGSVASVDRSSTMDLVLIADLFRILGELATLLAIQDDPVVVAAAEAALRIPAPVVAASGLIPEWLADRRQGEPHHRHVSHLYFVYPGDHRLTPALRAAASASLDDRGDESTGWALAWRMALRARLGQPEKVGDLLDLVFRDMRVDRGEWIGGLYPNFLVAHPPFQIDGNFGFVAALTECLMQSHDESIVLLPAVPHALANGSIRGIVARGGVEIDLEWRADAAGLGSLQSARLSVRPGSGDLERRVVLGETGIVVSVRADAPVTLTSADFERGA